MAASMLFTLRYLPRGFPCFSVVKRHLGKQQAGLCRRNHSLSSLARNVRAVQLLVNSESTTQCKLQLYNGVRTFHSSNIFYSEVTVVVTPPFAESITEGDVRWEKKVGDVVAEDELVAEIETDKTSIPVPAPAAGTILELLVEDGGRVQPGQELFKLQLGGVAAASAPPPAAKEVPVAKEAPAPAPSAPPAAAQVGPIPTSAPPIPPVPTAPLSSKPASSIPVTPATPVPVAPGPAGGMRAENRVKMNRMRLRIAQRLKDAQNTCAMLTTFNEIDMSNLMELRSTYKEAFLKKHGLKLGFMSAFLKASSYALTDQPAVNAAIDDKEIVYREYVDISVAVATPKGLVVPVIRNVETMNFADIEKALAELGEKARAGNLAIEDMDGGTFTVSNGGVFGSLMGTPIINPPQSAILGMHGIFERPVAVKGMVEIKPMMYIALTYDHRLIDGREAVLFLRKIKTAIEDPRVMLLDL